MACSFSGPADLKEDAEAIIRWVQLLRSEESENWVQVRMLGPETQLVLDSLLLRPSCSFAKESSRALLHRGAVLASQLGHRATKPGK